MHVWEVVGGFYCALHCTADAQPTCTHHPLQAPELEIDSTKFAKMAREAGFMDNQLTAGMVDLCFAKARRRVSEEGQRAL